MPTVKADIVSGATATISKDGNAAVRCFVVSDLPEITSVGAPAFLQLALNDPSIPIMGSAHPTFAGIVVQSLVASPFGEGGKHALVSVSYSAPATKNNPPQLGEKPRISVGSSVVSGKTQKGFDIRTGRGTDLTLTPSPSRNLPAQTASVDISIPLTVLRYTRRESVSPEEANDIYVCTINKNKIGRYAAHQLLCTSITGDSDDGGLTYVTTYEFMRNRDGWDIDVVYIVDGNPVSNPSFNDNTRAQFRIYAETDFNKIGVISNGS